MTGQRVRLLDCTLRDGGYYNSWDFDHGLVVEYLEAMSSAGISMVEIGFRSAVATTFLGAVAFSSEPFLESLDIPEGLQIGVMMNAKDLLEGSGSQMEIVRSLFVDRDSSKVSFVRIACSAHEFRPIAPAISELKEFGYEVGINHMQVHNLALDDIRDFGKWCDDNLIDYCYIADSFGVLEPDQAFQTVSVLREACSATIGCHFHDNKSLVTANVLAAIDAGVDIVDVTVTGMGRGPGNAKTEFVGPLLASKQLVDFELDPVITLIEDHFQFLLERYKWGSNPFYVLSALGNVHPSYAQRLLSDSRLDSVAVATVIRRLGSEGGASYSLDRAGAVEMRALGNEIGDWSPAGSVLSGQAMILGSGRELTRQRRYIESYLSSADHLTTYNLNLTALIDPSLVDYYVVLSQSRSRIDAPRFERSGRLITPHLLFDQAVDNASVEVLNYGAKVEAGKFRAEGRGCVIPHALTAAYALAVAVSGGARKIYLAGFDGFEASDPRQVEMEEVFESFMRTYPDIELISLTPTSYQLRSTSVFAVKR